MCVFSGTWFINFIKKKIVVFYPTQKRSQARILLKQKYVLIMGDSVQRGMYKDLVALLNDGSFMTSEEKRAKGEDSYRNDVLLNISALSNNTNFTEVRQYTGYMPLTHNERVSDSKGAFHWRESVLVRFVFITRAFNDYVKKAFDVLTEDFFPDVVCINSTFWDISRWDEHGHDKDREGRTFYPRLEQNVRNLTEHVNRAELRALKA